MKTFTEPTHASVERENVTMDETTISEEKSVGRGFQYGLSLMPTTLRRTSKRESEADSVIERRREVLHARL